MGRIGLSQGSGVRGGEQSSIMLIINKLLCHACLGDMLSIHGDMCAFLQQNVWGYCVAELLGRLWRVLWCQITARSELSSLMALHPQFTHNGDVMGLWLSLLWSHLHLAACTVGQRSANKQISTDTCGYIYMHMHMHMHMVHAELGLTP